MALERLWAPWRLDYVQSADEQEGCVFCRAAEGDDEEQLVAPCRHGLGFGDLDESEALEIHRLGAEGLEALAAVYGPDGFNLGWNVGRIAGAGIPDHVHLHVVPRWSGDTNFMPVLAAVKVIPEHLTATRRKLANAWPST